MFLRNIAISNPRTKGFFLVLIGAGLWGVAGTVAQYLFVQQGFSVDWLVVIRLLVSGVLLLGFVYRNDRQRIWGIWKNRDDRWGLVLFSILGMLAVQYTYFAAILHSNAATATVLQYLGPVLITCYLALRFKRTPALKEVTAVVLAVLGTCFLVTRGNIYSLSISGWALFWGLGAAVSLAFYTLQPRRLLAKWGSIIVTGWSMFIAGIGFSFIHPPWNFVGQWTFSSFLAVLFIILFGTLIAFYCYLESLNHLNASEASALACFEPLSAAVLSVIWLKVTFGFAEWLGTLCILSTIVILSFVQDKKPAN